MKKHQQPKESFVIKIVPIIHACNCNHEFQDKLYGKFNRVFNPMVRDRRVVGYRCTICKKEISR